MKYKYKRLKFCYFKARPAGTSSHIEYLLLEAGADLNQPLDQGRQARPGHSLGIAHQDHVSSSGSGSGSGGEGVTELCPLHQWSLPLVDMAKLCQYQRESTNTSDIT